MHRADRSCRCARDGARGVEVAVRLLRGGDLGDQIVEVGVQLRVGVDDQRVGGAFDDFEDVRVVEEAAFVVALQSAGRLGKVVDASGFLTLLEIGGDGDGAIGVQTTAPEVIVDRTRLNGIG